MEMDSMRILRRSLPIELAPVKIEPPEGIIDGYPIVFEKRVLIGGFFYEEIAADSLDGSDLSDIKLFVNHNDVAIPLARHRAGKRCTMEVRVDGHGMSIHAITDIENNVNARALCSAVERGDISDMSFAFGIEVAGEEWRDLDKPIPTRRITKIAKVFEVSAVNDGAYPMTEIYARSASHEEARRVLERARAAAADREARTATGDTLLLKKQKFLYLEEHKV